MHLCEEDTMLSPLEETKRLKDFSWLASGGAGQTHCVPGPELSTSDTEVHPEDHHSSTVHEE